MKPKSILALPDINSNDEFPSLRNRELVIVDGLLPDRLTETIKQLTETMEKIIAETTDRLIQSFTEKINELTEILEKKWKRKGNKVQAEDTENKTTETPEISLSNDQPQQQATTDKAPQRKKKKPRDPLEAPPQNPSNDKEQRSGSASKRTRSANTSTESTTNTPKDMKAGEHGIDD